MKELKFRVWDKIQKIMEYKPTFTYDGESKAITPIFFRNDDYYAIEEPVIMQYTGLKDKNGKEIYEGDIVKWKYIIDKVFFDEKNGGYIGESIQINHSTLDEIEVVGNIYENPELLEKLK